MTAHSTLNGYLKDLGKALKPLPESDIEDIQDEIESLVLAGLEDKSATGGLAAILEELGDPKTLASQYKAHINEGTPLPLAVRIARSTATGASRTLKVFTAVIGFGTAFGLLALAILKPFFPETVGIWYGGGESFVLGYPGPDSGLKEIMGYAIIPFGIGSGVGLFFLTRKILLSIK